jgi:hypothetical protein
MKQLLSFFTFYFLLFTFSSAQNVGIGPVATHARLEVTGTVGGTVALFGVDKNGTSIGADNPEIGFNCFFNGGNRTIKAGYASTMGMMTASGDFYINTFSGNTSSSDFGLITGLREALRIKQNGYLGVGTDPAYPLTVRSNGSGAGIVQESPDGTSQVGFWTSSLTAYLQTWTNTNLNFATGNGVSRMVLNTNGSLTINKSLNIGAKVISVPTGASNLLPIAFSNINQDGTMIQSTGNVAVVRTGTGQYQVTIAGENIAADAAKYTVMLTPRTTNDNINAFQNNWISYTISGGAINVTTGASTLATNVQITACGCNMSYLNTSNPADLRDCPFNIVIYKNN